MKTNRETARREKPRVLGNARGRVIAKLPLEPLLIINLTRKGYVFTNVGRVALYISTDLTD